MSKYTALNPTLHQYLQENSLREHPLLADLRKETDDIPLSVMQIAPEQGQFMQLLVNLTGAKRIIEVGTYTGYSSLAMALVLPADGHMLCCDISEEWTSVARKYWKKAGVEGKVELKLAPALETLNELLENGKAGTYDMMFVDADKANYGHYYDLALQLVRKDGLILFDNVLWDGKVIDPHTQDEDTNAIRALNQRIHKDERVELSMIPLADGLTIVRVR